MEELIKINLEELNTLEEVSKVIQKISEDGGSMKPFMFEINKKIQEIILGQSSEKGTFFGVPFVTVDRIDKKKVKEVLNKDHWIVRDGFEVIDVLNKIKEELGLG